MYLEMLLFTHLGPEQPLPAVCFHPTWKCIPEITLQPGRGGDRHRHPSGRAVLIYSTFLIRSLPAYYTPAQNTRFLAWSLSEGKLQSFLKTHILSLQHFRCRWIRNTDLFSHLIYSQSHSVRRGVKASPLLTLGTLRLTCTLGVQRVNVSSF